MNMNFNILKNNRGFTRTPKFGVSLQSQRGFTLVETLVAISILSLSIAATFTAAQSGIQNSTVAKDQTTAFYLAQEVMEYIKNVRDENALHSIKFPDAPRSWLHGIASVAGDPCHFGKVCKIDIPLKTVTNCGSAAITTNPPNLCPVIKQDPVTNLFGYFSGWTDTRFKIEIQLRNIVSDVEVEVVITISWVSRAGAKFFQASETLFNRQSMTEE